MDGRCLQTRYNEEDERAIVNGAHTNATLQQLVHKYVELFVLCPNCRLPESSEFFCFYFMLFYVVLFLYKYARAFCFCRLLSIFPFRRFLFRFVLFFVFLSFFNVFVCFVVSSVLLFRTFPFCFSFLFYFFVFV